MINQRRKSDKLLTLYGLYSHIDVGNCFYFHLIYNIVHGLLAYFIRFVTRHNYNLHLLSSCEAEKLF